MIPFFSSHPNQAQGSNDLANQQAILTNPGQFPCPSQNTAAGSNHQQQFPSQPQQPNHQFQNPALSAFNAQNAQLSNFIGNRPMMFNQPSLLPSPCYPNGVNVPHMMQNGLLGTQQQTFQQMGSQQVPQNFNAVAAAMALQGQFYSTPQNVNQFLTTQLQGHLNLQGLWSQNMPQHVNQMIGMQQAQLQAMLPIKNIMPQQCIQIPPGAMSSFKSPTAAGSTCSNSSSFPSDAGQMKNLDQHKSTEPPPPVGWNAGVAPFNTAQNSQSVSPHPPKLYHTPNNAQSGGLQWSQNHAENNSDISNVSPGGLSSQNFGKSPNGSWKKGQSQRFQSQSRNMANVRGNFRPFTGNRGRGPHNGRERNPQHTRFTKNFHEHPRRPLSVIYTEQEILQWREARKRNYPTSSKIEKRISGSEINHEVTNEDAKIRRQQLKEVLAKQAELGVEVAELPPEYILEAENQLRERDDDRKGQNRKGRFQGKYDKRRGRGRDNRYPKRHKHGNDADLAVMPVKRNPTLLQKLLSADIKRDKSKLLQVFRFITLNSFFEHWPEKLLVLPQVNCKDAPFVGEFVESGVSCGVIGIPTEVKGKPSVDGNSELEDLSTENAAVGDRQDDCDTSSSEGDDTEEEVGSDHSGKAEEGEITD